MKTVIDKRVKDIKALQEKNAEYIAIIGTMEDLVCCRVFQHYARITKSISFKVRW